MTVLHDFASIAAMPVVEPAPSALAVRQEQFLAALRLYETRPAYKAFGRLVATANVSLQVALLVLVWQQPIGPLLQVALLAAAWLAADFVNGLVHMVMDANDAYDSLAGPLIANFHLHHRNPRYARHPLPIVYFVESGSKIWLVVYLAAVLALLATGRLASPLAWFLVDVGILSSVAEVSHYLCHTSSSPLAHRLGEARILLSKHHHARHHREDNVSYAFLNGLTNPLLDVIAKHFSRGYRNTTDLHFADPALAGETVRAATDRAAS